MCTCFTLVSIHPADKEDEREILLTVPVSKN
jgi:hypothetical protein